MAPSYHSSNERPTARILGNIEEHAVDGRPPGHGYARLGDLRPLLFHDRGHERRLVLRPHPVEVGQPPVEADLHIGIEQDDVIGWASAQPVVDPPGMGPASGCELDVVDHTESRHPYNHR